jgi:hypothetical protein
MVLLVYCATLIDKGRPLALQYTVIFSLSMYICRFTEQFFHKSLANKKNEVLFIYLNVWKKILFVTVVELFLWDQNLYGSIDVTFN